MRNVVVFVLLLVFASFAAPVAGVVSLGVSGNYTFASGEFGDAYAPSIGVELWTGYGLTDWLAVIASGGYTGGDFNEDHWGDDFFDDDDNFSLWKLAGGVRFNFGLGEGFFLNTSLSGGYYLWSTGVPTDSDGDYIPDGVIAGISKDSQGWGAGLSLGGSYFLCELLALELTVAGDFIFDAEVATPIYQDGTFTFAFDTVEETAILFDISLGVGLYL
ncbi:hypothetical protein K8R78_01290 [bacterium]|nr:hypothetical protein [bacterium]